LAGIVISGDLALSNESYLLLSIPVMEMIKSATPLWTLLISLLARIEQPSFLGTAAILLMTLGV